MRIFMAVLWPILLVASAAMTTISYRKKKTGKADKDYYLKLPTYKSGLVP
jgi:hypothetical protein